MKRITWIASLPVLMLCIATASAETDWSKVDRVIGKKGSDLPGGVHKYGLPRSDLHVTRRRGRDQAAPGPRLLACLRADRARCHGDGRPGPHGHRNQSGDEAPHRGRRRDHRDPQSPAATSSPSSTCILAATAIR